MHRRVTFYSLQRTFTHPLRRHCSLRLSVAPILVAARASSNSNASTLDGEPQQNGGEPQKADRGSRTGCRIEYHALPPVFPTKPGQLPSFFLFLPPYLSTVLRLFCQSSRGRPSLPLKRHSSAIAARSLFCLCLLLPLASLHALCAVFTVPLAVSNAEEDVPGGFLSASSGEGL